MHYVVDLSSSSCPALCRASTSSSLTQDVDGRDKPGHDGMSLPLARPILAAFRRLHVRSRFVTE
jgi:hypothetical protein